MKFRPLGRSGVQVSQLCSGTMSFGGDADAAASAKMFRAVRDAGINFFDCADQYNKRQAEVEILPMAAANGVAVIPYSPAGGGLLSGKYAGSNANAGAQGRIATNKMYEERYGAPWMHEAAAAFARFCKERGFHPMSAAAAWVGSHPAVTAPIIGARSVE